MVVSNYEEESSDGKDMLYLFVVHLIRIIPMHCILADNTCLN